MTFDQAFTAYREMLNLIQRVTKSSRFEVIRDKAHAQEIVKVLRDKNFVIRADTDSQQQKRKRQ